MKEFIIGDITDMDGGPFRTPQSPERRPTSRQEPMAHRQPQTVAPETVREEPRPVRSTPRTHTEEKSVKRFILPAVVGFFIVALLAVGGWFAFNSTTGGAPGIASDKYQAVFFTNGQVYFGKLTSESGEYLKLTDVYYLQSQETVADESESENPQDAGTTQSNTTLVKLGDEIHGPEDAMIISREQVLFYENLKSDSRVAESISEYKNQ